MRRRATSQAYARYAGVTASAIWHLALLCALATYVTRPLEPRPHEIEVSIAPAPIFMLRSSRPKAAAASPRLSERRPSVPEARVAPVGVAAPAQTAATASSSQPPPPPTDGVDGRVRNVLRSALGCADSDAANLSDREKEACAAQAEARAKEGAPMPLARMEPRVEAYYDAVNQTQHGGNLPGAACAFGQGKLDCRIIPPHGVLTEELGLAPP